MQLTGPDSQLRLAQASLTDVLQTTKKNVLQTEPLVDQYASWRVWALVGAAARTRKGGEGQWWAYYRSWA